MWEFDLASALAIVSVQLHCSGLLRLKQQQQCMNSCLRSSNVSVTNATLALRQVVDHVVLDRRPTMAVSPTLWECTVTCS